MKFFSFAIQSENKFHFLIYGEVLNIQAVFIEKGIFKKTKNIM
jgi:hypothetical protein